MVVEVYRLFATRVSRFTQGFWMVGSPSVAALNFKSPAWRGGVQGLGFLLGVWGLRFRV